VEQVQRTDRTPRSRSGKACTERNCPLSATAATNVGQRPLAWAQVTRAVFSVDPSTTTVGTR
jgi:hypothetical protein